jgi:adenylylsulfate kinase
MNHLHPVTPTVGRAAKEARLSQCGQVIWLYGLSGAGKTTLSAGLESHLAGQGFATVVLDGDNLRAGLNRDLGFGEEARTENLRRAAEVAKLLAHSGLVTICAFITPRAAHRAAIRAIIGPADLQEVYLSASLADCSKRDPKGLYAKAQQGGIAQFTGVGQEFEPPGPAEAPLVIDTGRMDVGPCLDMIMERVLPRVRLKP